MPRETKAQKATRIGLMLADYDARSRELRKLAKTVDELKAQIREEGLTEGKYGDFTISYGTPREILDQKAAREALKGAGIEVPTQMTEAPLVVKPAVGQ